MNKIKKIITMSAMASTVLSAGVLTTVAIKNNNENKEADNIRKDAADDTANSLEIAKKLAHNIIKTKQDLIKLNLVEHSQGA